MKLQYHCLALAFALALVGCSDKPSHKPNAPATPAADVTAPFQFSAKTLPPAIVALSGLSHAEDWGRWTDGPSARIDFAGPLPKKFTLDLNVKFVYGQNSAKPTAIKVGNASVSQLFNESGKRYSVTVETDGTAKFIEFAIPAPLSPAELDNNPKGDQRKLGLGFSDMKITPLP